MNIRKESIISYIRKITEIKGRNDPPPSNNTSILTNYFHHIYSAFRSVLHNFTSRLVFYLRIKASEQKTQKKKCIYKKISEGNVSL